MQIEAVAGEGKIDVVWSKVDDSDIVKYRLYRSENGHDYELIYESALMSYTDSNVLYGNTYIYMVKVCLTLHRLLLSEWFRQTEAV